MALEVNSVSGNKGRIRKEDWRRRLTFFWCKVLSVCDFGGQVLVGLLLLLFESVIIENVRRWILERLLIDGVNHLWIVVNCGRLSMVDS